MGKPMSLKPNLLALLPAAAICLFSASLPSLMAAEPKVYRCGPAGSQWYSQIPCEEDSEEVIVEDHHMFSDTPASDPQDGSSAADDKDTESDSAEEIAASKAQAFITQLEKQRSEQLAEIDRRIDELESSLAGDGGENGLEGSSENDAENEQNAKQLSDLKRNRQSIVSEYEAMISAARQRIGTP
jgi:hypothetical protein